jgi:hypothetical protein
LNRAAREKAGTTGKSNCTSQISAIKIKQEEQDVKIASLTSDLEVAAAVAAHQSNSQSTSSIGALLGKRKRTGSDTIILQRNEDGHVSVVS